MFNILEQIWPILVLLAFVLGLWVSGLVFYTVFGSVIESDKTKTKVITDLTHTKRKLIEHNKELEEEIRLRDERNSDVGKG